MSFSVKVTSGCPFIHHFVAIIRLIVLYEMKLNVTHCSLRMVGERGTSEGMVPVKVLMRIVCTAFKQCFVSITVPTQVFLDYFLHGSTNLYVMSTFRV